MLTCIKREEFYIYEKRKKLQESIDFCQSI